MKILVSACLIGENCKYDGGNNRNEKVLEFLKGHEVIPVCPEQLGGLPTPRPCSEIVKGIVTNCRGDSVDYEFRLGADIALKTAQAEQIDLAVLQSRSPSCGVRQIYDGTFSGTKTDGHGIFAEKLIESGFKVIDAADLQKGTSSMKTVSVKTMRESDAAAIAGGIPSKELMKRAGEGIVRAADWKAPVAVVCGKGNNAGDGYVVADILRRNGIDCTIILLSDVFSEDGRYYFDQCLADEIPVQTFDSSTDLSVYNTILDCILGTGFRGDVTGITKEAIDAINRSGAEVISADIPSGLNGDTGEGDTFVQSDLCVSIGTYKTGHFRGRCREAMRKKVNIDIGIPIVGPVIEMDEDPVF